LLESRLAWIREQDNADLIRHGLRGIEKECLRVDERGRLSRRAHPTALGSALTHPYITTDYSEALLEFVTPPSATNWETLQFLCDLHSFVVQNLDDELLWAQSMPCIVRPNEEIPIAYYGESHIGRIKTIYRRGLGHRYGRAMQAIAGVHFNYSLPTGFWQPFRDREGSRQGLQEFVAERYLHLARNFRRHAWLLIYLFGASPALCKSFPLSASHGLSELDADTWYLPFGTSLRMSDVGYRNTGQAALKISLNSLGQYVNGLRTALDASSPEYETIGVLVDGDYRQLNTNLLQIENEYYAAIRPKPRADSGTRVWVSLLERGIEYLEIRTLDLNMLDPVGINQTQLRFVEALLLYCLFIESPMIDDVELAEIDTRELLIAREGRKPGLSLPWNGKPVPLAELGRATLDGVGAFAEILDGEDQGYVDSVALQRAALTDASLTPSARILETLRDNRQSFFELSLEISRAHRDYFRALGLSDDRTAQFRELATASLSRAAAIETARDGPFEDFLEAYFTGS
jgi:glutamate--cysteine ligase